MPQVGVGTGPENPRGGRKRRVHQHHRGPRAGQVVGDRLGVVAGHCRVRKQSRQQAGPGGGDFVQAQFSRAAFQGERRHDCEHAGACGRLEHHIAKTDAGGPRRGVGQREGRGKLLQPDLFLGASGVGGLQPRQGGQHGEHPFWPFRPRPGVFAHGAAVLLQEEHQRRLGGFVGVLPPPGAIGVGGPESGRHGVAERFGIQRPAGRERGKQPARAGEQGMDPVVPEGSHGRDGDRCFVQGRRTGIRARGGIKHGGISKREAKMVERTPAAGLPRPRGFKKNPRPGGLPAANRRPGGVLGVIHAAKARGGGWGRCGTEWRDARRGEVRTGTGKPAAQQKNRPSTVNVQPFTPMVSSMAASEVWLSYSRSKARYSHRASMRINPVNVSFASMVAS